MKQSQEIVSAVGETNILIIVGTPGQGPRTFSVAKFDRSHISVIVRIKSVNTESNHSAGTKYVQVEKSLS
jgi:hypothetical protein